MEKKKSLEKQQMHSKETEVIIDEDEIESEILVQLIHKFLQKKRKKN